MGSMLELVRVGERIWHERTEGSGKGSKEGIPELLGRGAFHFPGCWSGSPPISQFFLPLIFPILAALQLSEPKPPLP